VTEFNTLVEIPRSPTDGFGTDADGNTEFEVEGTSAAP
jgi:hypothetical protein